MKVFSYFDRPGSLAGAINFAHSLDRTHQEFKDECDINVLLAKYHATGTLPQPWKHPPVPSWGDFSEAPDYFDAQRLLLDARQAFGRLSSKLRLRFNNDPGELLAFVGDVRNREEAQKLGLLKDPPAVATPPAPPKTGG